jgi:hypothetical protein
LDNRNLLALEFRRLKTLAATDDDVELNMEGCGQNLERLLCRYAGATFVAGSL